MNLVKQLREKTGAGMLDVKACLVANGWDMDKAFDALRAKGLAAAAKKSSRHAAEGLISVSSTPSSSSEGPRVAIIELNSETDFVSRSPVFRGLASSISLAALSLHTRPDSTAPSALSWELDESSLLKARIQATGLTVNEGVTEVAAQVREHVRVRRGFYLKGPLGSIASTYLHMSPSPGLGNIASVVLFQPDAVLSSESVSRVEGFARDVAMHAAGLKPLYLDRDSVPSDVLERERSVLMDLSSQSGKGKSQAILAKMVEGRMGKFYEDTCLLDQKFLLDDSMSIKAAVAKVSKEVGVRLVLSAFLRIKCGEGLASTTAGGDFASEVSRMAAMSPSP